MRPGRTKSGWLCQRKVANTFTCRPTVTRPLRADKATGTYFCQGLFLKVSSSSGVNKSCSTHCSRDQTIYTSGVTGSFHSRVPLLTLGQQQIRTALSSLLGHKCLSFMSIFFFSPEKHTKDFQLNF